MSKLLKFAKDTYEGADLEVIGNVKDVLGKGGTLTAIKRNIADHGKQVMLLAKNKAGDVLRLYCSKAVSKALRDRTLTLSQVIAFEIIAHETQDGVEIPLIIMPASGVSGTVSVTAEDGAKAEAFAPSMYEDDDLVAL